MPVVKTPVRNLPSYAGSRCIKCRYRRSSSISVSPLCFHVTGCGTACLPITTVQSACQGILPVLNGPAATLSPPCPCGHDIVPWGDPPGGPRGIRRRDVFRRGKGDRKYGRLADAESPRVGRAG